MKTNLLIIIAFIVLIPVFSINTDAQTIGKAPPPPVAMLPDLYVISAVVKDAAKGLVEVRVANKGNADAKNCQIKISVYSSDWKHLLRIVEVNQLPLNATKELTMTLDASVALWDRKYQIITDAGKNIKESDEMNNHKSGYVAN
jgi:hypothetical protein